MEDKLLKVAAFNPEFNRFLPVSFDCDFIYQSVGLEKHIIKRHPDCVPYLNLLPTIIDSPDYIGVNPNESVPSFELVKIISENVQIGIKLDIKRGYLYVATLHTITTSKLQHNLANGRLKKI